MTTSDVLLLIRENTDGTQECKQIVAKNFKGERGLKGDKGDTGATGAQGPKGDKGDRGADGATGQLDGVKVSRNRLIAILSNK